MDYRNLTSPCGLDCFNCPMYLANNDAELRRTLAARLNITADKAVCHGCRNTAGTVAAIGRNEPCYIYRCIQEKELDFCHECADFPCDYLHPYADQADRRPHNTKVFNLCLIKKLGLDKWAGGKARSVKETYFKGKIKLNG